MPQKDRIAAELERDLDVVVRDKLVLHGMIDVLVGANVQVGSENSDVGRSDAAEGQLEPMSRIFPPNEGVESPLRHSSEWHELL